MVGHLVYININLFPMFHYIVLNIIYIYVCARFVDIICVLLVERGQFISCDIIWVQSYCCFNCYKIIFFKTKLRTSEEWIEISELERNKERHTTLDASHETMKNKTKDATPKTIKMDNADHTYQRGNRTWIHVLAQGRQCLFLMKPP